MPFCPNKTIFVTSRLKNCSNKTGCFSTLQGHTVNFARPRLKFGLSRSSGLTNPLGPPPPPPELLESLLTVGLSNNSGGGGAGVG